MKTLVLIPTVSLILVTNGFLLYSIVYGDWTITDVVTIYWFENILAAVVTITQLRYHKHYQSHGKEPLRFADIQVFALVYGIFTLCHGIFFALIVWEFLSFETLSWQHVFYGILLLCINYAFSYGYDFIYRKRYQDKKPIAIVAETLKRIAPIHLFLILGMGYFLVLESMYGTPVPTGVWFAIIIITLKTIWDVGMYYLSQAYETVRVTHNKRGEPIRDGVYFKFKKRGGFW